MAYRAKNYASNPKAPLGKWVCTRTSSLDPFDQEPPVANRGNPDFCGQCVSYLTTVCEGLPVNTSKWRQGALVKGNAMVFSGTAIATFNVAGKYSGHAAIYVDQSDSGITVVDQWVTPPAKPIHQRLLRFGARGNSNNGDNFYVIE